MTAIIITPCMRPTMCLLAQNASQRSSLCLRYFYRFPVALSFSHSLSLSTLLLVEFKATEETVLAGRDKPTDADGAVRARGRSLLLTLLSLCLSLPAFARRLSRTIYVTYLSASAGERARKGFVGGEKRGIELIRTLHVQSGWSGCCTGNRKELSSSQAQLGQATCLAVT